MLKLLDDIYFRREYVSLYLKNEDSLFEFCYREKGNVFSHLGIKRPINTISNRVISEGYFDVETAYGYGGYFTNTDDSIFISRALEAYCSFCRESLVIAEFIRFHPFQSLNPAVVDWFDFFSVDRKTVVVDLSLDKETRWSGYHKKTRNILRRCSEKLSFKEMSDIDRFSELYSETMLKNKADDFYFFDERYFEKLLELDETRLFGVFFGDRLISAGYFMFGEEIGHYHLSGNSSEFASLNGNYFLLDSVCDVMRDFGLSYFHLGGGRSSDSDDTLLKFKKKFSSEVLPFQIAGKVFNRKVYNEYNALWDKEDRANKIKYFLKYRL